MHDAHLVFPQRSGFIGSQLRALLNPLAHHGNVVPMFLRGPQFCPTFAESCEHLGRHCEEFQSEHGMAQK